MIKEILIIFPTLLLILGLAICLPNYFIEMILTISYEDLLSFGWYAMIIGGSMLLILFAWSISTRLREA